MPVRIFRSDVLSSAHSADRIAALVSDFRKYKESGELPSTFGRDVPYHRPPEALFSDLRHIHLVDTELFSKSRASQFMRTSDSHLVYCSGFKNPDCFLLVAILDPNAHSEANDFNVMRYLIDIATGFRSRF